MAKRHYIAKIEFEKIKNLLYPENSGGAGNGTVENNRQSGFGPGGMTFIETCKATYNNGFAGGTSESSGTGTTGASVW